MHDQPPGGVRVDEPTSRRSARVCEHPHKAIAKTAWLIEVPATPMPTGQLVLTTEVGLVPYCGWDNQRGNAAAGCLGRRFLDAGIVIDAALVPDSVTYQHDGTPWPRYTDERFALPQMVLSMALAEREERFCVADNIKRRMAEYPRQPWTWRTTTTDPSAHQSGDTTAQVER